MKLAELIEKVECPPTMKMIATTALFTLSPKLEDADVGLAIDRDAQRVRVTLAGDVVFDKSFDELEAYVAT